MRKKAPINNSAQPDSLGSTAIQLSQLILMIKKVILGASRREIKKRARTVLSVILPQQWTQTSQTIYELRRTTLEPLLVASDSSPSSK
jgi:hypothetical protein